MEKQFNQLDFDINMEVVDEATVGEATAKQHLSDKDIARVEHSSNEEKAALEQAYHNRAKVS